MASTTTLPRASSPLRADALSRLMPDLRSAALAAARRSDEADDLFWDAVLEWLVGEAEGTRQPVEIDFFVSVMRTSLFTRTRVGDRLPSMFPPRVPDTRRWARAVHGLPPREREAVVLLDLLRLGPQRAAELAGCSLDAIQARQALGQSRLAASGLSLQGPEAPRTLDATSRRLQFLRRRG